MACVEQPVSESPRGLPLATRLPNGLGQNGGRVDSTQLDWLRPSSPTLPLEELRQRLRDDGYIFVKGLIPREDVLDAREKWVWFYPSSQGTDNV